MGFITIILLAFGLCFDSFAVSLSHGMAKCRHTWPRFLKFAAILALFQGAMPLMGWALTSGIHYHIARLDHWIAFVLLTIVGIKMIMDSFRSEEVPQCDGFQFKKVCVLGLATSIDALVAGVVLAVVDLKLWPGMSRSGNMLVAVGIIAVVTFCASLTGLCLGKSASGKLGGKAELAGGVVLILLGIKILVEHLAG